MDVLRDYSWLCIQESVLKGGLRVTYTVRGIELGSATCEASTTTIVVSLWSLNFILFLRHRISLCIVSFVFLFLGKITPSSTLVTLGSGITHGDAQGTKWGARN